MEIRVAALVLNWRDSARTLRCVDSLIASPLLETVLVVDNESGVESDLSSQVSALGDKRVELLPFAENRGFAGGVNPGLHLLDERGIDWVLVINNDATMSPENLAVLVDAARTSTGLSAFGPTINYPSGEVQARGSKINWRNASVDHAAWPGEIDYLTWACVLVSTRSLRKIGYLNEAFFMYWEDADFGLRLKAAGGSLVVCENAIAVHEESATKSVIGPLTMRYATASMATFVGLYPRLRWAARYRLVMRVLKQALTHGFSVIGPLLAAWKWGRVSYAVPGWQRIASASWATKR